MKQCRIFSRNTRIIPEIFKGRPRVFYNTIICLISMAICFQASAQTLKEVNGKVTDHTGIALPGVSILVKGSLRGVSTDKLGEFSIKVLDSDMLLFSMIGYKSESRPVKGATTVNVSLQDDLSSLDEVVIIGYGTQKKTDLTGSVGSVKSQQLQERPSASLNQQLAGRITGVQVNTNSGRPGGQTNIRIRGFSSIGTTNNPLYVIDGIILPVGTQTQFSNAIDFINPSDIASVEILKDASATAIYGARGANGVILISTKKGSTSGGKITYDIDVSQPKLINAPRLLNAKEFMAMEDLIYVNAAKYDPIEWAKGAASKYKDPKLARTNPLLFDSNGNPLYDTDWFKESTQNKLSQNHQLSLTNGNENGSYGVYAGYRDESGLLLNSWLKRYSSRFVFDTKIKSWLKVDGSISYNAQDENIVDQGTGGLNSVRQMVETIPILPVKYPNGVWAGNKDYRVGGSSGLALDGGENPVNILTNTSFQLHTQNILGNLGLNINLAKDLEFRSVFGTSIVNRKDDRYSSRDLARISLGQKGIARVQYNRDNYWSIENYLTYKKRFAKIHSITSLLGVSWNETTTNNFVANTQNFLDDYYQTNNLGAGSVPQPSSSGAARWAYNSYFGRLNYSLSDKYLFTFTGRADGASKFGTSNKYAFFPSGAFAWRASDEEFLKDNKIISNLKLRTSYGITGNSEINTYSALASLGNGFSIFNNVMASSVGIGNLANPDLRWEKTAQADAGIELGLIKNRISIEADVYKRITNDMILAQPVPTSSGYSSINRNIGSMENRGLELALNTVNVERDNFSWSSTFNISMNRNKVTKLATPADIFPGPNLLAQTQIIRVGEPVGSLWGYVRLGTWGTAEASEAAKYSYGAGRSLSPGDVKLQDLNNDYVINSNDQKIIGNVMPKAYGSLYNTFRLKNLDLTVELQYSYGNDILNMTKHSAEDRLGISNSYASVLNAWTPTNQNTDIAEMRSYYSYAISNVDSHWVEDGSFIRGKNLLLGYNFTSQAVKKLKLNRLRIYGSVQNFFLADRTMVNDPEVSTYGNAFSQGQTFFDYPKPRTFMIGLNLGL